MRRLFSSDGISPKSCSICHTSEGSSTSIVKYLETATPTESKPGPILADVAGTVIFIIIHQKEESHQRLFSLIPFLYAPIRAYQLVRQNFQCVNNSKVFCCFKFLSNRLELCLRHSMCNHNDTSCCAICFLLQDLFK